MCYAYADAPPITAPVKPAYSEPLVSCAKVFSYELLSRFKAFEAKVDTVPAAAPLTAPARTLTPTFCPSSLTDLEST